MKDRVVEFPNRYRLVAVEGQDNVYDFVAVPGTVTEEGTIINKANLLTDTMAARFGLTGDPSVNDAFGATAAKWTTAVVLLPVSEWSSSEPYTQTVSVSSVTADNIVDVAATPTTFAEYLEAAVYASEQGDGTLTFVAQSLPEVDLYANVRTARL